MPACTVSTVQEDNVTTDPFAAAQVSGNQGGAPAVEDPFGQKPSEIKTSDFPTMDDLDRALLVIQPTKLERDLPDRFNPGKTKDRITADVTVIDRDNPAGSKTYRDMFISQGAMIGQLKGLVETRGMLLGVLRRDRAKNTPEGYNTPDQIDQMIQAWIQAGAKGNKPSYAWKLQDFTETDKTQALAWYRSKS